MKTSIFALFLTASAARAADGPTAKPPEPFGATPSALQVKYAEKPFYAFCHFGINTFTGSEWGSGGESEKWFNPTDFGASQIVAAIKASGATGVILTGKHHDGFCLWPTATTGHNVSASPWRDGKGDVLRDFSTACKAQGME